MTYSISWTKGGSPFSDAAMTTTVYNDTILATATTERFGNVRSLFPMAQTFQMQSQRQP